TNSDNDLLRLMRSGDEEAFALLYRRRQAGVFRFALQMSGSREVAEDVTQEVFIVLISEAERYDSSRGSVAAFLYGIARNHVLRRLQRDRDRTFISLDADSNGHNTESHPAFVAAADPLGDLTRAETVETLRSAILTLPAHYREVVVLCDLHEMDYREAASVLGCSIGTVRSRLHRARNLLVEKLRANDSAEPATGEANATRCFV
ncbi:MAG TPA: RNA polymerase sigma factor, partial [Blastocatellia bacterium]|nr:RNA polymerase sigma factor [Blastocatellia bacterium]